MFFIKEMSSLFGRFLAKMNLFRVTSSDISRIKPGNIVAWYNKELDMVEVWVAVSHALPCLRNKDKRYFCALRLSLIISGYDYFLPEIRYTTDSGMEPYEYGKMNPVNSSYIFPFPLPKVLLDMFVDQTKRKYIWSRPDHTVAFFIVEGSMFK